MAYRVLARAYRSSTFDEVVGQDAVTTTLRNAIKSGRIHHGYLFTGTRGVGKTSMARILAKALNCLEAQGPTTTPCLKCDSCIAIAAGEDVDVVEIDAASNNGVENIRDLRGNATLRPARARFKIYIVDEVHMLSMAAFNALLKTLEEPPAHVKFILATTESQKVPATIQSRCQRFDFRAIDAEMIAGHLRQIVKHEKIDADDAVLRRVARLANGSMRDALSLLDMLLSYDAKQLTREVMDTVVPPPHDELSLAVIEKIGAADAAGALLALDAALQTGRTVDRFCDHLIEHVRTLMLLRICGAETELVDAPAGVRSALVEQAQKFDAPTFVYMIAMLEELRRNVKFSGAARALADAAVVRLSMSRQFTDVESLLRGLAAAPPAASSSAGARSASPAPGSVDAKKKDLTSDPAGTSRPVPAPPPGEGPARSTPDGPDQMSPAPTQRPRLNAAEVQKAAADPFIQKIRDAFGGTLIGIRQARVPLPAGSSADSDDAPDVPAAATMDETEADAAAVAAPATEEAEPVADASAADSADKNQTNLWME